MPSTLNSEISGCWWAAFFEALVEMFDEVVSVESHAPALKHVAVVSG